jgi:hypothetical protein
VLFTVIERFKNRDALVAYRRFNEFSPPASFLGEMIMHCLISNKGEQRNAPNNKTVRRFVVTFRFGISTAFLLFTILAFTYKPMTPSAAQEQLKIKVNTYKYLCGEKQGEHPPLANVEVKFGEHSITTGADGIVMFDIPPGTYEVMATAPGYRFSFMGWDGGGTSGTADIPSSATKKSVILELKSGASKPLGDSSVDVLVGIAMTCDDEQGKKSNTEKENALSAVSTDCKDFNDWEGTYVSIAPPGKKLSDGRRGHPISDIGKTLNIELTKYALPKDKVVLKPGSYELFFHIPESFDPEKLISPKISKVEVYKAFPKLELVAIYPADEVGFADITLDESLWKDNSTPYIKVYVAQLCDYSYATIEFFEGSVEVTRLDLKPEPAQAGMSLGKDDKIKTGQGSSVQLKAKGEAYLINIGESSEMNMGAVLTGAGRKFIQASIKTGKVQVQRLRGFDRKKMPSPEPLQEPNNSEPVTLPSSQIGVIVKTPTATITDKKTIYMVNYDEKANVTTVGVEEGEADVTPGNLSLKPVTLTANQQVKVSQDAVSDVTYYASGKSFRPLLYFVIIGIGLIVVIVLVALIGLVYFFYK